MSTWRCPREAHILKLDGKSTPSLRWKKLGWHKGQPRFEAHCLECEALGLCASCTPASLDETPGGAR